MSKPYLEIHRMTRWHVRKRDHPRTPWEVRTPDGRVLLCCSHHHRAIEHANRLARRIRPGSNIEVRRYPSSVAIARSDDWGEIDETFFVSRADLPALITALTKAKEQA